ncbi:BZ3501_MvSof-1269-A2-R1_C51g00272 [Microbotryum saponariae]|nr:BZ3501_MvSof-1269-A2-R1_C51g00272 [Microbotryum saponariae]
MPSRCRFPCATKPCLVAGDFAECIPFRFPDELGCDDGRTRGTVDRPSMVKTLKSSRMELNSSVAALAHTSRLSLDIASRHVCGSLVMDLTG